MWVVTETHTGLDVSTFGLARVYVCFVVVVVVVVLTIRLLLAFICILVIGVFFVLFLSLDLFPIFLLQRQG